MQDKLGEKERERGHTHRHKNEQERYLKNKFNVIIKFFLHWLIGTFWSLVNCVGPSWSRGVQIRSASYCCCFRLSLVRLIIKILVKYICIYNVVWFSVRDI